jgi:hypothetical protein
VLPAKSLRQIVSACKVVRSLAKPCENTRYSRVNAGSKPVDQSAPAGQLRLSGLAWEMPFPTPTRSAGGSAAYKVTCGHRVGTGQ